ncbi:hypothetical protein TVAG_182630 [Trichomonas vaginalis G3]|uniref:Uncharacterized protein n=1 Tax=Trichomonas vaginalis (strain ATCC PRA-98 / G3) TaxID=412133 RepID=A2D901_TRIV3|nr:hypothetical protein TVAGG3_0529100 [Trichomonas vaginalis G3]EAY23027.1 hypothetical protein TVAG_182630 [Trichomonas vaginalis G3]KAI5518990.1 hypothetical protein TVAGG3_0529100 [Trichomonas vaginalis G3]|eukprot:XP_001584013.1 hypothetical protein [Trichomonas vaginalis G3]
MQGSSRPKTAMSSNVSKLPELPMPKSSNGEYTVDDITDIKLKTNMMIEQRKLLGSKIQRAKQLTKERNQSIESVFSQTAEKQCIQTASPNTIKSLKETADSLEYSVDVRQKELEKIKKSDKLSQIKELQVEIQLFYLEHKRLVQKQKAMAQSEKVVSSELDRIRQQSNSSRHNEERVKELQQEINGLTDRLFAYTKSEAKLYSTKKLKQLYDNPDKVNEIKQEIQKQIAAEEQQMEANQKEMAQIQKKEQRNVDFLHKIIDEQAARIRQKLENSEN